MPKEQRERLEELVEVVKEMEQGRAEEMRDRRREEAMRKREIANRKRLLKAEIRKSSREVKARESQSHDVRRELTDLEKEEETLISRKLKRDDKFEESFAKVKSKESEKNLQRLSKRTETNAAHEKLSHLKVAMRGLEQKEMRAIADDLRGAIARSSPRAGALEAEVQTLQKESQRLDEENTKLRQALEKASSSLPPKQRQRVMQSRESSASPQRQQSRGKSGSEITRSASSRVLSPVQLARKNKDESISSPTFASSKTIVSSPNTTSFPSAGLSVSCGDLDAKGPTTPAYKSNASRSAITPIRVAPASTLSSSVPEAVVVSTTNPQVAFNSRASLKSPVSNVQQAVVTRPVGPWAWSAATVEAAPMLAPVSMTKSRPVAATPLVAPLASSSRLPTPSAALRSPTGSPSAARVVVSSRGYPLGSPTPAARIASTPGSAAVPVHIDGKVIGPGVSSSPLVPAPLASPVAAPRSSPTPVAVPRSSPTPVAAPGSGPRSSPIRLHSPLSVAAPVSSPMVQMSSISYRPSIPAPRSPGYTRSNSTQHFASSAVRVMSKQATSAVVMPRALELGSDAKAISAVVMPRTLELGSDAKAVPDFRRSEFGGRRAQRAPNPQIVMEEVTRPPIVIEQVVQ
jgi:hypothetical protein